MLASVTTALMPQYHSGHVRRTMRHAKCVTMSVFPAMETAQLFGDVDNFYRSSPLEAAALTCGVKAACSDTISQLQQKRAAVQEALSTPFCWSRNRAFMLYGAVYQGGVQHFLYNSVYPKMFGESTDLVTVMEKVAFDNLVHVPFLCLPTMYLLKAVVFDQPLPEAVQRYVADAKADLLWKYWAIWTPAQCLTFSVVPEHLRIPFVALVSFFWLIILSNISTRPDAAAEQATVLAKVPVSSASSAWGSRGSR